MWPKLKFDFLICFCICYLCINQLIRPLSKSFFDSTNWCICSFSCHIFLVSSTHFFLHFLFTFLIQCENKSFFTPFLCINGMYMYPPCVVSLLMTCWLYYLLNSLFYLSSSGPPSSFTSTCASDSIQIPAVSCCKNISRKKSFYEQRKMPSTRLLGLKGLGRHLCRWHTESFLSAPSTSPSP